MRKKVGQRKKWAGGQKGRNEGKLLEGERQADKQRVRD